MIDVILTSFARWDLLERTLESFFEKNTEAINNFWVYDDKGRYSEKDLFEISEIAVKFKGRATIVRGTQRVGQIDSVDFLFNHVKTKYVLTLEDDWECMQGGFIAPAIEILENNPNCVSVWLRGTEPKALNNHPIIEENGLLKLDPNHSWHGFSFGASIKRLSDYQKIGSYGQHAKFIPKRPWESEKAIDNLYHSMGMWSATLPETYFKHIGENRGIRK